MLEFTEPIIPLEVLQALFALALCSLLILRGTIIFLFARERMPWTSRRYGLEGFFCLAGVLMSCFLVADLNQVFVDRIDRAMMLGLSVFSAVAVLLFAAVSVGARFGTLFLKPFLSQSIKAVHLALLIGAALWFANRTQLDEFALITDPPQNSGDLLSEDPEYFAITDAGAQLPLFEIDLRNRSDETRQFLANSAHTPAGAKVIPRAEANINANCHGWVFTGGKYLLRGNTVDHILHDNGYTLQGHPAAGDLIIYRTDTGGVLHTGIVSGILLDGTCIIESKWGISGRFLHQAEDQPYGLNYAFYRSERSGHLVTIIHRSDVDSFMTNSSPKNGASATQKNRATDSVQADSELDASLAD